MAKFLAIYTGQPSDGLHLNPEDREKGMQAWGQWMSDHAEHILDAGGPLGSTKRASADGIADVKNNLTGYVILEAPSHEEAAKLFLDHPHFTIFPGDGVEIMVCPPIPEL